MSLLQGLFWIVLVTLGTVGCRKDTPPPAEAMDASQAKAGLSSAFSKSAESTRELAKDAGEAIETGKFSEAYSLVERLGSADGLSPEERAAAVKAKVGLLKKAQEAAAGGDAQAAAMMEAYRATK